MIRPFKNANCDGSHCTWPSGETRRLPYGGEGNVILCRSCYEYELRWRRERNEELGPDAQFELPAWETLAVYPSV